MIMATQGKELRVLSKHNMNIQPGDPVELVSYDGQRLPKRKQWPLREAGLSARKTRSFLHVNA